MAMNGRQKAMTAALGASTSREPTFENEAAMNPLEFLRMIVEACDRGEFILKNLRMETFRSPMSESLILGSPYMQRRLIQTDQFAGVSFEVRPGAGAIESPSDFGFDQSLDEPERPSFDVWEKPSSKAPKTKPPATPVGAGAARDVIFDDDGNDPT
jgi:hypothetical protein